MSGLGRMRCIIAHVSQMEGYRPAEVACLSRTSPSEGILLLWLPLPSHSPRVLHPDETSGVRTQAELFVSSSPP